MPLQVLLPDGSLCGCELTEASPLGFRLRTPRRLPRRVALTLRFPSLREIGRFLDVPAEVLWNRSGLLGPLRGRAGGRFLPMDEPLRERLAERLLVTSGVRLVDLAEKRREVRVLQPASPGRERLMVRDLSAGGVGLLAQHPVPLGGRMEIVIHPEEPILCPGEVVWCRPARGGHAWHLGVRFDPLPPEVREALARHLARMLRDAEDS